MELLQGETLASRIARGAMEWREAATTAISVASGLGKTAKATQAKILRLTPGSPRRSEIAVNLKTMLNGKGDDIDLRAEDILYVPTSLKKDIALKTLDSLGGAGAMSVLYRVP